MLKNRRALLIPLVLMAGCASYEAATLQPLHIAMAEQCTQANVLVSATLHPLQVAMTEQLTQANVLVSWKIFDQRDAETYLGRDTIAEGYVPLQITVINQSGDPIYLSANNFSVPLASANEVANKVHTSTAGRVVGWGIPGLLLWPLLIPAVYDGISSSEANQALDADYLAKTITQHTIHPQSNFNGVVFIPRNLANQPITMFLVNQKTGEQLSYSLLENANR